MVYRDGIEAQKARLKAKATRLRTPLPPPLPTLNGVEEWLSARSHYAQLSVFNTSLQYKTNPD